jgi:hypothetical protein
MEVALITCDAFDGRIDFEKDPALEPARVRTERSDAQADHSNIRRIAQPRQSLECLSKRARAVVIDQRLIAPGTIDGLQSVNRRAVIQRIKFPAAIEAYAVRPEKCALRFQHVRVCALCHRGRKQHRRDHHGESRRAARLREHHEPDGAERDHSQLHRFDVVAQQRHVHPGRRSSDRRGTCQVAHARSG